MPDEPRPELGREPGPDGGAWVGFASGRIEDLDVAVGAVDADPLPVMYCERLGQDGVGVGGRKAHVRLIYCMSIADLNPADGRSETGTPQI
jgi:hypothetical protein